jgi:predicted anti-sigma-YlaC factor YlaD
MFEDALTGYSELSMPERQAVDAHVVGCSACREYLDTLTALDQNLTALYSGLVPSASGAGPYPAHINAASVRQPSALPEILDFCGWAAVVAILAVLTAVGATRFGITLTLPHYIGWYAAGAAATVALLSRLTWRKL